MAAKVGEIAVLLEKKRGAGLTKEEDEELEHYFILEHIVRLAKSRARLRRSTNGLLP